MYSYPLNSTNPISPPIPLATYQPSTTSSVAYPFTTSALYAQSSVTPPTQFHRQTSTSSQYDAYAQPTPLSSSSLEQGTVYRGVFHGAEPTVFAQAPQTQLWHSMHNNNAHTQSFNQQQSKKLELPELTYAAYNTTSYAPIQPMIELPSVPSHVERFTSFYSSSVPAIIAKSLRIGFQTMQEMRVDFVEEAQKGKVSNTKSELTTGGIHGPLSSSLDCLTQLWLSSVWLCSLFQFRGQCYTEDNESIQFIARVYKSGLAAPAPYLVEFQRRCGDSVAFFRFFQKMLKNCHAINQAPFETSFSVAGMNIAPLTSTCPLPCSSALNLPNMQALTLDLPTVSSLCNMSSSDCIESKRESAKCLAKISASSGLFPPKLERQTSAYAASEAIWKAIVNIFNSGDSESAHLGAQILRNCLARGDTDMLFEHLSTDKTMVPNLVARLNESTGDDFASREIRRQVAAVLTALVNKKGQAYVNSLAPNAVNVLNFYNQQQ